MVRSIGSKCNPTVRPGAKVYRYFADGWPSQSEASLKNDYTFRLICINCDSVGIVLDFPENAPNSLKINCRNCNASRGTLGDLRALANADRQILFDV